MGNLNFECSPLTTGRKVDNIISSVRNQTHILENTLANKIRPQLVELADIFDQPASNQTALSQLILSLNIVQGNVTTAKNAATDIRRPLMQVTITSFLSVRFGHFWDFCFITVPDFVCVFRYAIFDYIFYAFGFLSLSLSPSSSFRIHRKEINMN